MQNERSSILVILGLMGLISCRVSVYHPGDNPQEDTLPLEQPFEAPAEELSSQQFATLYCSTHLSLQNVFNQIVVEADQVIPNGEGFSQVNYEVISSEQSIAVQLDAYWNGLRQLNIFKLIGKSKNGHERDFRKAFWINLYNACAIQIVRENYKSIKTEPSGINAVKAQSDVVVWNQPRCPIGPKGKLSLNQIENAILRNGEARGLLKGAAGFMRLPTSIEVRDHDFFDRRIHYGINCVSGSCPMISREVFSSENINRQLNQLEKLFWTKGREAVLGSNNTFQKQVRMVGKKAQLNHIFEVWYAVDFENRYSYFSNLIEDALLKQAVANGNVEPSEYNWRLNASTIRPNYTQSELFAYEETIPEWKEGEGRLKCESL